MRGTGSKAGFGVFRPSFMCCVNVVVEWCDRKPCCESDRGICGVTFVSTSFSSILNELQNSSIPP